MKKNKKYSFIDLFAGCGGLEDGFLQSERFKDVAAVEWLLPQVETLRNRLKTKWKDENADEKVMHFDIQREEELFNGWENDEKFGTHKGLDYLVEKYSDGIDLIIGGPPCQAYSVAGRVRDENGMKKDYRNYLFEHYLSVVNRYKPKVCIFENVPGMLSASPNGGLISDEIREGFKDIGYEISQDLKKQAVLNAADFGVPQNRKRVIIFAVNKKYFKDYDVQELIDIFYKNYVNRRKVSKVKTVEEAIGDLEVVTPIFDPDKRRNRKAYEELDSTVSWHEPRYHNIRDMETFKLLAEDIENEKFEYTDSKALSKLYEERVGSKSPIHRYYVLRRNEPSTTIIAHLYKDGNRFIHYDSKQARTITPREAARLQSFPDDYEFVGSQTSTYQMIGNAVPPLLAKKLGIAIADFLDKYINIKEK